MIRKKTTSLAPRPDAPESLLEEFDRTFADFRTGLEDLWTPMLAPAAPWGRVRPAVVDLKDAGKEFVLTAKLPGVAKEDVGINVSEDGVEIRARAGTDEERKDQGYYYRERSQGEWYRRLPFPAEVVPDEADAELKDGVLTMRVPKKAPTPEPKPRRVRVK